MIETIVLRNDLYFEKSFYDVDKDDFINKKTNNAIINFEQVDYARDGYHFDILTCQKITDLVAKNLNI